MNEERYLDEHNEHAALTENMARAEAMTESNLRQAIKALLERGVAEDKIHQLVNDAIVKTKAGWGPGRKPHFDADYD